MDILHPFKHYIYGCGIVSYLEDNSLQFSISALGKEFNLHIHLNNSIKEVSLLLVNKDSSHIILCHAYGILVVNTSELLNHLLTGKVAENYMLP